MNPLESNDAIIAPQVGVWSTNNFNDNNPNWSQSYNGMRYVSVTSLDYWNVSGDNIDNKIIAATYGSLVFTGKFTSSSAPDTTAPSAPTALTSAGNTDTYISLTWTAATDNTAVTSCEILRGTTIVGNTANTNFTATGLTANTAYSFSVKAKDKAGNISKASNTINLTTAATPINYCASQSSNTNNEFISRVQLGCIDNSSGAQFYSHLTGIAATVTKGSSYTITITRTWTGTTYNEGYAVWVDFNKNGDFTDAGEQVLSVAPNQNTTVSASFTIPTNAIENTTKMRVSMSKVLRMQTMLMVT